MRPEYEIRLCRPEEIGYSWALEQLVWKPWNWRAEGAIGVAYDEQLHLVAVDPDGVILATIDAVGCEWDGDPDHLPAGGWSEIVMRAQEGFSTRPTYASALGASVRPGLRGGGLAGELLAGLRDQALSLGYAGLLAPVLPSFRWRMPHLGIDDYADLRMSDGRHFDPWIRVHERLGGEIIGTCERSASFRAPREDWERWCEMRLPDDGAVVVEYGGLLRLRAGIGTLTQPSVWVLHGRDEQELALSAAAQASVPAVSAGPLDDPLREEAALAVA